MQMRMVLQSRVDHASMSEQTDTNRVQQTLAGGVVTHVVNKQHTDTYTVDISRATINGQRKHLHNADVGTPGWLGNPYPESEYGRTECIDRFREDFHTRVDSDKQFRAAVTDLRGEILGCYCKPKACHGDVIVSYLTD